MGGELFLPVTSAMGKDENSSKCSCTAIQKGDDLVEPSFLEITVQDSAAYDR